MSLTIDIEMYVLNATLQKAEFLSETSHLKIFFGVGFGVQLFCNNVIKSGPLFRANKLSS